MNKGTKSAKKEGHVGRAGKSRVAFRGYVNYTPNEQDKAQLKEMLSGGWDAWGEITDILTGGYKISISWDGYHDCFSAALYCTDEGNGNSGWNLPARASDPYSALVRAIFLHVYILSGDWSGAVEAHRRDEEW